MKMNLASLLAFSLFMVALPVVPATPSEAPTLVDHCFQPVPEVPYIIQCMHVTVTDEFVVCQAGYTECVWPLVIEVQTDAGSCSTVRVTNFEVQIGFVSACCPAVYTWELVHVCVNQGRILVPLEHVHVNGDCQTHDVELPMTIRSHINSASSVITPGLPRCAAFSPEVERMANTYVNPTLLDTLSTKARETLIG